MVDFSPDKSEAAESLREFFENFDSLVRIIAEDNGVDTNVPDLRHKFDLIQMLDFIINDDYFKDPKIDSYENRENVKEFYKFTGAPSILLEQTENFQKLLAELKNNPNKITELTSAEEKILKVGVRKVLPVLMHGYEELRNGEDQVFAECHQAAVKLAGLAFEEIGRKIDVNLDNSRIQFPNDDIER